VLIKEVAFKGSGVAERESTQSRKRRGGGKPLMKRTVLVLLLVLGFLPFWDAFAAGEHVAICRMGEKDPAAWGLLRKYLAGKGYRLSIHEGTADLATHIENTNRINAAKAAMLLVMDFGMGEQSKVMVAVTEAQKGRGRILAMEEVPAAHIEESRECAQFLASSFGTKVKEFPLFPVLGVNAPALFIKMECTKENAGEMLDRLYESLQKCLQRSVK
jgi:hypothetical protein